MPPWLAPGGRPRREPIKPHAVVIAQTDHMFIVAMNLLRDEVLQGLGKSCCGTGVR